MENEITILSLCEANYLFLKPDVLYKFEVSPNCKECNELAKKAEGKIENEGVDNQN